jgi:hypothetical protein
MTCADRGVPDEADSVALAGEPHLREHAPANRFTEAESTAPLTESSGPAGRLAGDSLALVGAWQRFVRMDSKEWFQGTKRYSGPFTKGGSRWRFPLGPEILFFNRRWSWE